ncbi:MAG: exosome complex RNA-binding protein Csl4 [Candidatus Geothermarchaeota archaeon]
MLSYPSLGKRCDVILPGNKIGIIEEYVPCKGTYVDKNGIIRSLFVGTLIKDEIKREVYVIPVKELEIVNVNSVVTGRIIDITGVYGHVTIEVVNNRILKKPFIGILYPHVYTTDVTSLYSVRDYVVARVVSKANRAIHLSIEGDEFGVIRAYCRYCGNILKPIDKGRLKCSRCNNIELRKTSINYGKLPLR